MTYLAVGRIDDRCLACFGVHADHVAWAGFDTYTATNTTTDVVYRHSALRIILRVLSLSGLAKIDLAQSPADRLTPSPTHFLRD